MSENSQVTSAILLSVTQSVVVFGTLLPPFAEVRKADKHDTDMRADVRLGEMAASALVIGIGLIATGVTSSPGPAAISVIMALILVGMYESVLNNVSLTKKEATA